MSNIITGPDGNELPKEPANVKIRVIRTFKLPQQTMASISEEVKALTPKDMDDFKDWFNAAGYPTT